MEVRFTIRGEPKGKGRPRFCRNTGHAMTPKDTVNYETLVRTEYSAAYPEFKFPDGTMLDMRIMAYYSIPKSASKKKKASFLNNLMAMLMLPISEKINVRLNLRRPQRVKFLLRSVFYN